MIYGVDERFSQICEQELAETVNLRPCESAFAKHCSIAEFEFYLNWNVRQL